MLAYSDQASYTHFPPHLGIDQEEPVIGMMKREVEPAIAQYFAQQRTRAEGNDTAFLVLGRVGLTVTLQKHQASSCLRQISPVKGGALIGVQGRKTLEVDFVNSLTDDTSLIFAFATLQWLWVAAG